jgi:hypothetical protein
MKKAQWEEWAALIHHTAYKINFYLEKLTSVISAPPKKAHVNILFYAAESEHFWEPCNIHL